jgi:hypothetical protein
MGLLIVKIYCGKLSFDTLGCNKALALSRWRLSPQIGCLISYLAKNVKMVDNVDFFAKNA